MSEKLAPACQLCVPDRNEVYRFVCIVPQIVVGVPTSQKQISLRRTQRGTEPYKARQTHSAGILPHPKVGIQPPFGAS